MGLWEWAESVVQGGAGEGRGLKGSPLLTSGNSMFSKAVMGSIPQIDRNRAGG